MSYHLKLKKALSYTGIVEATAQRPDVYTDDKATAEAAVATGYFTLVGGTAQPEQTVATEPEYGGKTLEEMTVSELETYAAYNNVSLKGISKKADIIAKLKEELGEEAENEVDYGSPTMTELQDE